MKIRQPIPIENVLQFLVERQLVPADTKITYQQFKQGQSNPTYLLILQTPDETRKWVLRKQPPGILLDPTAHSMEREYKVMKMIKEKSDLKVPEMLIYVSDRQLIGTTFYIMTFVEGQIYQDVSLPSLQPSERAKIWKAAVSYLAKLHRIKVETKPDFYPRQIKTLSAVSKKQQQFTEELPQLSELLSYYNENIPKDFSCLIHGDFKIDNIIYSPQFSIEAVLDWELSTIGHPLSDLANLLLPFYIEGKFGDWTGLKNISKSEFGTCLEELLDLYCKEMRFPYVEVINGLKRPQQWHYFVSFSFFRMAVILQGVSARRNRQQASSEQAEAFAALAGPSADYAYALISTKNPHIGHLYSTVLSDALKRFYKFAYPNSLIKSITGTDEHGLKIQQAANKKNLPVEQHCLLQSQKFKDMTLLSGCKFDVFTRTTDQQHFKSVQHFWNRLKQRGFIQKGHHEGWYAVQDETFYPESQIKESIDDQGRPIKVSIETLKPVEWVKEENYLFPLEEFRKEILKWLERQKPIYPPSQMNHMLHFLNEPLLPLSISRPRSRQSWGIPVPNDSSQTIYVWLDALVNYLTANGYPDQQAMPSFIHILGKDITKFHAIYWPAFLLAAGFELPRQLISHAHWTVNHVKMSKSLGNTVDPFQLIQKYGSDPVRYFLLRDGGINDDSDFHEDLIKMRIHAELADQLGNLFSRCLGKNLNPEQRVPTVDLQFWTKEDDILKDKLNHLASSTSEWFLKGDFPKGLQLIVEALHATNQYIGTVQPWKLIKSKDSKDKMKSQNALFLCLEALKISGLLLESVMPSTMDQMLSRLSVPECERTIDNAKVDFERQNKVIQGGKVVLFQKK